MDTVNGASLRPKLRRTLMQMAGLAALVAGTAQAALAQQSPPVSEAGKSAPKSAEGVQTFEAAYFGQYNPVTAGDMVSRVPGFEIVDGEVLRGFGATAGNVLVNGERPSSKVLISEQLKRIPATAVARIELISGSASNVDVRGQTQLVNVVLKSAKAASPTTWVAEVRDIQYSERLGWTLQLTKKIPLGDTAELTVDLQAPNLRGRTDSFEAVRNPSGGLTAYREQFGQPNQIGLQGSGSLKWRPTANDTISVNAQYVPTWNTLNIASITYLPSGAFAQGTFGETDYKNNFTGEIAGDWEHRFSPVFSVKALALATFSGVDQNDVYHIFTPAGLVNTPTYFRTTEAGERVARGVATWRASPAHTLEFGAEGAFNFRDTTLDIFNNFGAGPVDASPPVANARVEETRGEAFVTDVWKLSPKLTLETGFTFEASKISQTGDEQKERTFSYPKPRATLTWQAGPGSQFRASAAREVAQLDFSEFATSINVIDATSLIGNPNLEPEKTWKLRGEWERKFGKRGALTLAVFHDAVTDTQDLVEREICIGSGSIDAGTCAAVDIRAFDAPGNIGDGTRTGVEVRGAAPLSPFIPRAELRFSGLWQKTEVTDPITGANRRFANEKDWNYSVSFRQELPAWKSAWGATVARVSDKLEYKRAEDISYDRPHDRLDLFAETTQIKGVTLRFSASNIFSATEDRVRTFYASDPLDPALAPRATDVLARTETRKQKGGPDGTRVFSIRASGAF
jgi:outer membrane receptor for ferrienterochelin and colicin